MNKSRTEAFSDGVMAIIITIMVLDLKVPAQAYPKALLSVLPRRRLTDANIFRFISC